MYIKINIDNRLTSV